MTIESNKQIKKILKSLPDSSGVYLMKDKDGVILYVGKAISLKNRVRQYFHKAPNHSIGTRVMMKYIEDIDFIMVSSEIEALMLETTLIKKYQPRYNVRMRDDKNFVYIKVTTNEDFPQILTVRKMMKDKAKYFGPYTSATVVKSSMKVIQKIFPYRTCSGQIILKNNVKKSVNPEKGGVTTNALSRKAPCLDYHIKRCDAPCIGNVSFDHYREMIDKIVSFLRGDYKSITTDLKNKIGIAVEEKKFEIAARLRDQMLAIQSIMERQKVISTKDNNQDILTPYKYDKKKAFVNIVEIRGGKLIDVKNIELYISSDSTNNEIIEQFIVQYYQMALSMPSEIVLSKDIENKNSIDKWFKDELKCFVDIVVPKSGFRKKLLELGFENAEKYKEKLDVAWDVSGKTKEALELISQKFKLKKSPKRIECYDISHMSGTDTVGSMTVLVDGFSKKDHYRQFKIRGEGRREKGEGRGEKLRHVPEQNEWFMDDCASLREVLKRRLDYLSSESKLVLKNHKITLSKAKKKDVDIINKILVKEKLDSTAFDLEHTFVLRKKKNIVGTIILREIDKDFELSSLWVHKDLRKKSIANNFVKSIQKKYTKNKLYIVAKDEYKEFFLHLGFVEINKIKESLEEKRKKVCKGVKTTVMMWKYNYIKPDVSFSVCPDLIVLDGGKGQLSVVKRLVKEMNIPDIPMVGFAKKEDKFYMGSSKAIQFPSDSEALYMLQRVRDEAHRFANSYREELGTKKMFKSRLDDISGIGEKTKTKLLKKFGSMDGIKKASEKELIDCVGGKLADILKD